MTPMPVEGSPLPKLESRFRGFLAELDRCEGFVPGHSVAVCKTALRLAGELGVSAEELPGVALGALMHDIGKVFVDGRLLGKPVPLTRAELETIRLHPQLGEALLAPTVSHALVLGIVRWHHERWDGGGYPDRLEGAATPLGARIVATADAFVAMGESRTYREPRGLDETLDELRRLSGSQFDPACVEALVETIRHQDGRRAVA
jgi:HD-GYP domain-containing protein (c-di-GMP phosphodiesterase class II)